ncbi:MAG: Ig-like domain-containing protein, partial [Lachnospiraceae bacterium]|nr:Ig-like domain-containing protein [Lachnospiraceae bacterium]
ITVTVIAPVIPKTEKTIKMTAGDTCKLTPPEVGELDIAYDSASPDIASVDEEGNVTALSKGSAVINAYVNGVAFKYTVKVSDTFTGKYDFSQEIRLVPNQALQIKIAGFKPAKATWTSETQTEAPKGSVFADQVVMISKAGKMTAIGEGTTVLTATGGSAAPVSLTVTVSSPVTRTLHVNKGTSKTVKLFGVKGTPNWVTEDAGIRINGNKITGDTSGEKNLTAKCGNFEYRLTVFVEDPSVNDSSFSGKNYNYSIRMSAGETREIKLTDVNRKVVFIGNKNHVAFADRDLVIHARSRGKSVLSATVNGKKIRINVTVE